MHRFVRKHVGSPMLVLGTGPSAFRVSKDPQYKPLLQKLPSIAINRGFALGLKVNYQISLDRIWHAVFKQKPALECYNRVHATYAKWCKKHGATVNDWTLEDFVAAYWDQLHLHPEIQVYFKLCSLHAPFTRFVSLRNHAVCPYVSVPFGGTRNTPMFGRYVGSLFNANNTAHAAIHLAAVMAGNPIFLLGIDMAKHEPKIRPWERCAYARAGVLRGFRVLRDNLGRSTRIVNLNPSANLSTFERVKGYEDGLRILRSCIPH